jgi:hypothetical protein
MLALCLVSAHSPVSEGETSIAADKSPIAYCPGKDEVKAQTNSPVYISHGNRYQAFSRGSMLGGDM